MAMFCSAVTGGFYPAEQRALYESKDAWPVDAVELTEQQHIELKAGLAVGKVIVPGPNGLPTLADPIVPPMTAEQITAQRLSAYRAESDPLKIEAEYDAQIAGSDPDYSAWLAKVAEIKERFPLPE